MFSQRRDLPAGTSVMMIDAKQSGKIIDEVDPSALAVTIAATMESELNAAKVAQNPDKLHYSGKY